MSNLDEVKMLTMQEAFAKGYLAVINQGEKSVRGDSYVYFNPVNNHRCAIGHLVNLSTAIKWDNCGNIKSIIEYGLIFDSPISNIDAEFLIKFQQCHDRATSDYFLVEFKANCSKLASKYNLEIPEIPA